MTDGRKYSDEEVRAIIDRALERGASEAGGLSHADLLAVGEQVFHILAPGKIEPATMNEAARQQGKDVLVYPAPPPAQSDLFDRQP